MKSPDTYYRFLQKKGVDVILACLRYVPKRYNIIRNQLSEQISSRTLDVRLKELVDNEFLSVKIINEIPIPGHEYSLSNKGSFLEAIISTLNSTQLNPSSADFSSLIATHMQKSNELAWNSIWSQLRQIMLNQGYIETLTQHKRNEIVEITESAVIIRTEKGEKPLEIEQIKNVWDILVKEGSIAQNDYDKATYRSAFMLGLLSNLDCVKLIDEHPIQIALK